MLFSNYTRVAVACDLSKHTTLLFASKRKCTYALISLRSEFAVVNADNGFCSEPWLTGAAKVVRQNWRCHVVCGMHAKASIKHEVRLLRARESDFACKSRLVRKEDTLAVAVTSRTFVMCKEPQVLQHILQQWCDHARPGVCQSFAVRCAKSAFSICPTVCNEKDERVRFTSPYTFIDVYISDSILNTYNFCVEVKCVGIFLRFALAFIKRGGHQFQALLFELKNLPKW